MWWFRRRQRTHAPRTHAYGRLRIYADTVEASSTVVDEKDNGHTYEVSWVRTEEAALAYLRGRDVRLEGYYVIVETPQRNVGRDMITIFDETDGSLIEVPERTPLPALQASTTHCARCGYPVLPCIRVESHCDEPECGHPWHTQEFGQSAEEVILWGFGYRCTQCRSAACRACYEATGRGVETTHGFVTDRKRGLQGHPADELQVRVCWVCGGPVTVFTRNRFDEETQGE